MHYNKNLSSILLVQPHLAGQEAFIAALESIEDGFLFGVVSCGTEALDILQRSMVLPDLIFMELNLGATNGIHYLKEIQIDPLTNDIPVIVLVDSAEEHELSINEGAKGTIFKLEDQEAFRNQIEIMLHSWSRKSTHSSRKNSPE